MITIPPGVRYMFLSALFFAMMGGCVKGASIRGIPVLEILAARALISSILSYIDIRRKGISPWGENKLLLIARGATGTIALFCVFYAVTTLPLAEATLLQYIYPAFTAVLAFFFLKERIRKSTIICILLSLAGPVIMVQPDFLSDGFSQQRESLPPLGVIAALIGALGSATAYVIIRQLSSTEHPSVIIFYFPFIALPVSALFLKDNIIMPEGIEWLLLLLVGLFTQLAQYCLTMAIQCEKASKATAFSYVQVLFSALIGWIFFQEFPTPATFLGGSFIIAGALVNVLAKAEKEEG